MHGFDTLESILADSSVVDQNVQALALKLGFNLSRCLLDGTPIGDIKFDYDDTTRRLLRELVQDGGVASSSGKDRTDFRGRVGDEFTHKSESKASRGASDKVRSH